LHSAGASVRRPHLARDYRGAPGWAVAASDTPSNAGRPPLPAASGAKKAIGERYRLGRRAGVPVVAGASSGIQVIASRSYLNPFAAFSASFVEFITRYHLLLSLLVTWTALNGMATSFSPMPRKPPTPTISAVILPSRSTSTSMISPILLSPGSYTFCLYQWVTVTLSAGRFEWI